MSPSRSDRGSSSDRSLNHRHQQIEAELRRAIQQVLSRGLNDPRARGMISVTEVDLSPDLKNASVMVSIFPEKHESLTLHALVHAGKHIRHEIAELVALQRVPELMFKLDTTLKQQAEVFDALRKAAMERQAREDAASDAASSSDTPNNPPV
jgi:ribosome-binding factor A